MVHDAVQCSSSFSPKRGSVSWPGGGPLLCGVPHVLTEPLSVVLGGSGVGVASELALKVAKTSSR